MKGRNATDRALRARVDKRLDLVAVDLNVDCAGAGAKVAGQSATAFD